MKMRHLIQLCVVLGLLSACGRPTPTPTPTATVGPTSTPVPVTPTASPEESPAWFRDAIVYEVVPCSFYDSNGDGLGDLRGITARLDYIQMLGANTLWLTPIFSSTSTSGFDVMDFYSLAPGLGTKDDLAELVKQAHNRNMRVVMDLVIAYTSNQFPQFKEALGKPDSRYSDWYQWTNTAHTAYKSYANLRTLPLLNHKNADVQTFLFQVAQEWLRVGVDGFRLGDATSVPHEFWKSFRQAVKQVNPVALVMGEVWEADPQKLAPYFQDEFDVLFDVPLYYALAANPNRNGGGLLNGSGSPSSLDTALGATRLYSPTAQLVRFAGAHNTNRIASLVNQAPARERMAPALILTLPGTPLIYYGDEIGMPGSLGTGAFTDEYRRAPMDWAKSGKSAGMTTWFKDAAKVIKPNDGISVEEQQNVKGSLLSLYQMLIAQRKGHAALRGNNLQAVASPCKSCYAYLRWDANDFYLIAFNFSNQTQAVTLDLTQTPRAVNGPGEDVLRGGTVSLPSNGRYTLTMDAWETRILHWGK
jgi:alpha-amylase